MASRVECPLAVGGAVTLGRSEHVDLPFGRLLLLSDLCFVSRLL